MTDIRVLYFCGEDYGFYDSLYVGEFRGAVETCGDKDMLKALQKAGA